MAEANKEHQNKPDQGKPMPVVPEGDTEGMHNMSDEESILKKKLLVFGTDVGTIPCFRNSFLYGITGGIGAGIAHFAVSSRVQNATRFGFWSYVGITFSFWCYCRYDFTMTKFRYSQLQYAMKENASRVGTSDALQNTSHADNNEV